MNNVDAAVEGQRRERCRAKAGMWEAPQLLVWSMEVEDGARGIPQRTMTRPDEATHGMPGNVNVPMPASETYEKAQTNLQEPLANCNREFIWRGVKRWNGLFRGDVEAPSWAITKSRLDAARSSSGCWCHTVPRRARLRCPCRDRLRFLEGPLRCRRSPALGGTGTSSEGCRACCSYQPLVLCLRAWPLCLRSLRLLPRCRRLLLLLQWPRTAHSGGRPWPPLWPMPQTVLRHRLPHRRVDLQPRRDHRWLLRCHLRDLLLLLAEPRP